MKTSTSRLAHRLNRWLHESESLPRLTEHPLPPPGSPKHDEVPPPKVVAPHLSTVRRTPHDQPWVPTGGLVGRKRRNERKAQ
jgi:hypothetical protein